jgi:hypothetical protein
MKYTPRISSSKGKPRNSSTQAMAKPLAKRFLDRLSNAKTKPSTVAMMPAATAALMVAIRPLPRNFSVLLANRSVQRAASSWPLSRSWRYIQ